MRRVEVAAEDPVQNVPCEVVYGKDTEQPGVRSVLWSAETDAASARARPTSLSRSLSSAVGPVRRPRRTHGSRTRNNAISCGVSAGARASPRLRLQARLAPPAQLRPRRGGKEPEPADRDAPAVRAALAPQPAEPPPDARLLARPGTSPRGPCSRRSSSKIRPPERWCRRPVRRRHRGLWPPRRRRPRGRPGVLHLRVQRLGQAASSPPICTMARPMPWPRPSRSRAATTTSRRRHRFDRRRHHLVAPERPRARRRVLLSVRPAAAAAGAPRWPAGRGQLVGQPEPGEPSPSRLARLRPALSRPAQPPPPHSGGSRRRGRRCQGTRNALRASRPRGRLAPGCAPRPPPPLRARLRRPQHDRADPAPARRRHRRSARDSTPSRLDRGSRGRAAPIEALVAEPPDRVGKTDHLDDIQRRHRLGNHPASHGSSPHRDRTSSSRSGWSSVGDAPAGNAICTVSSHEFSDGAAAERMRHDAAPEKTHAVAVFYQLQVNFQPISLYIFVCVLPQIAPPGAA